MTAERAPSEARWDDPKVVALANALSEADLFYDDRDWLILAEVALVHLGIEPTVAEKPPGYWHAAEDCPEPGWCSGKPHANDRTGSSP